MAEVRHHAEEEEEQDKTTGMTVEAWQFEQIQVAFVALGPCEQGPSPRVVVGKSVTLEID